MKHEVYNIVFVISIGKFAEFLCTLDSFKRNDGKLSIINFSVYNV